MYTNFDTITNPYKQEPKHKRIIKTTLFLLLAIVIGVCFVYLATHYAKPVHGASMQPTLNNAGVDDRDIVIVNKYAQPNYSDIVILDVSSMDSQYTGIVDKNASLLIKRVIAKSGDRIRMEYDNVTRKTTIYLNGTELIEDYITEGKSYNYYNNFVQQTHWQYKITPINGEITIPEGMIFCMGDNRDNSKDCRYFGPVKIDTIQGVVESILPDGSAINSILTWLFKFE